MQLKKETNQRSTDLETTISQYYQQILTNSNSINDLNNKLQELGQLQQEQKDMNENENFINISLLVILFQNNFIIIPLIFHVHACTAPTRAQRARTHESSVNN